MITVVWQLQILLWTTASKLSAHASSNVHTVAQKTAPMFTHFSMIVLAWDADIIQGPETFVQRTILS